VSALLKADPQAVRQAAAALDGTAEEAAQLGRQLDRQRPTCWRSPSSRDYVGQLARLEQRVGRLVRSHDTAAAVLTGYAAALEEAQDRARYARALQEEGQRRSAEWGAQQAVGPDPGWPLVQAAQRTLHDAELLEQEAGRRAAERLRELSAAAPSQSRMSKALRPLDDLIASTVDGLRETPAGLAALGGAAWSAVPVVHGEREQREGRRTLLEAAKIWEAWVEAGHEAVNGRPGLAAGMVLTERLASPRRVKQHPKDPYLNGIEEGRLTVNDVDDAWVQAHAAKALHDRIASLRKVPLPGLQALLKGEADLEHHEARGGHTIQRHVAKSIEALQARLDLETNGKPGAHRSTFPDLATAQDLVRRALLENGPKIHGLHDSPKAVSKRLRLPLGEPVGTVLHQDGSVTSGTTVVVVLKKGHGELYVETAWLEP
jgi:uncharacterized protein YukE